MRGENANQGEQVYINQKTNKCRKTYHHKATVMVWASQNLCGGIAHNAVVIFNKDCNEVVEYPVHDHGVAVEHVQSYEQAGKHNASSCCFHL